MSQLGEDRNNWGMCLKRRMTLCQVWQQRKKTRIWDLSCKVFNSKNTLLCYPASRVLPGKQKYTLLVLSGTVWIATASPADLEVWVGLDEVVRALREAAERCPESLWCMPGNSRQGAQTLMRCWGNHTNSQMLGKSHKHLSGSCQSRSLGQSALVGWRLLSAGLWWFYSRTQHWERDGHWGRENGLNVQHFGTCSWGNYCRSKYGFIHGSWPVCRRFSLLWYPEDSSKSETQHGKNGKISNWSSTLLTETVTCCNEQLRFFFSIN